MPGRRNPVWRQTLLVSLVAVVCLGCSDPADPPPTHSQDFAPGPGDVRVVNSDHFPLDREYWLIHRQADGNHYLFPRPDGHPNLVEACAVDDDFGAVVRETRLCASGANQADVARMNSLTLDEALAVSTFLHQGLKFTVEANSIRPYALISDRALVCQQFPDDAAVLSRVCGHALPADEVRPAIALVFTAEEATVLATRLNQLYGVAAPG